MIPLLRRAAPLDGPALRLTWNGQPIPAQPGDTVLTALLLAGDRLRTTLGTDAPRAGFCLMGACQDCWVELASGQRVRACSTLAEDGMALVDTLPGERP